MTFIRKQHAFLNPLETPALTARPIRAVTPPRKFSTTDLPAVSYHIGESLSILIVTWNMAGTLPTAEVLPVLLPQTRLNHDLLVIGTQECERSQGLSLFCCFNHSKWERILEKRMQGQFVKIGSKSLDGIHLVVFLKPHLLPFLGQVHRDRVKLGFCGFFGNKGAVKISLILGNKRFIFATIHLTADQEQSHSRCRELMLVMNQIIEKQKAEEVFVFGDMNYRMDMSKEQAAEFTVVPDKQKYFKYDQLIRQMLLQDFLHNYQEGHIQFSPTYKLEFNANTYEPNRIPGWTDRIFYRTANSDLKLVSYFSDMSVMGSDHRPVFAEFTTSFLPH